MHPTFRKPARRVFCFFTVFLLAATAACAQTPDTVFVGDKWIIRDNILITLAPTAPLNKQAANHSPSPQRSRQVLPNATTTSRTTNTCGVIARFTPEGDTTISGPFQRTFEALATNATSFTWYLNGFPYGNSSPITFGFSEVGLHELKLVARNGSCTDTAVAYYFQAGTPHAPDQKVRRGHYGLPEGQDYPTTLAAGKDGGFLLGGYTFQYNSGQGDKGLLIKLRESGCVEWTKIFSGATGRVNTAYALKDSGFLVSLNTYLDGHLMRLNKNGAIRWQRSYKTSVPIGYATDSTVLGFRCMYEASDGSIYAAASHGGFNGFFVVKLDATGNLLWNKYYKKEEHDFATPAGITQIGNNIFVSGFIDYPNTESQYNSEYNKDGFVLSLQAATGATNWTKAYGAVGGSDFFQEIHAYGPNLLVNNIRTQYLGAANARQTFHYLDQQGNVLKSSRVVNPKPLGFPFTCRILPLQNDRLYLTQCGYETLPLQPGYMYHSEFLKIDTANNIAWQATYGTYSRGRFLYSDLGKKETLAALGVQLGKLLPVWGLSDDLLFARIDSSGIDTDNSCEFSQANFSIVSDEIVVSPLPWAIDSALGFRVSNTRELPLEAYAQARYLCPEYIDSCSYVKVNGPVSVCNLSDTYTYRASRNKGCNQPVEWSVSEGVEVISQNDQEVTVRFPAFGIYRIGALLANYCTPVKDSITIVAASRTAPLGLGADTSLCPNTSITLSAGRHFLNYQWHDGSTDSLYTVTTPGSYWVQVVDSCGNTLRDTIHIAAPTNLFVDAGPDRTKCNNDTLHLTAPAGYHSYSWSNNYNISGATSRSAIVNPLVDTAYYLKAEKSPGCFAYDTVRIQVFTAPPISLGADTSLCQGDSLVLDAGPGFSSYLWHDGATTRQLTVFAKGTYPVRATTAEGCPASDTLRIRDIYANPVVQLNDSTTLCTGSTRLLDPGTFGSYLWHNGSTGRTFTAADVGSYAVRVTDHNGCQGGDTITITSLLSPPRGFLPPDTAICSYGSLLLKADQTFRNYRWSTGSLSPSITIKQAGNYWLQVADHYGCTGTDDIIVAPKECLSGLYVPTGFTPNGDGRNDVLRALLFGNINQYQFTIFDRWGQVVFRTSDPAKGWNGAVKGKVLDTGVFVWACTYQLEGEAVKTEKGTVTLIR